MLRFLKSGDIFCFKYDDHTYCFGRIMSKVIFHIVEIFDYTSDQPIITGKDILRSGRLLVTPLDTYGLFDRKSEGEWRIIGRQEDYTLPEDAAEFWFSWGDRTDCRKSNPLDQTGYKEGVICELAKTLLKYLDGMKEFYEKHIPDAVESYNNFEGVLGMYGVAPCSGCRSMEHNGCSIEGCFLLECTKNHNIDFCGECDEFPCKKTVELFEEEVYKQWLEGNRQIRDYGIESFWENNSGTPHYKSYKK